MSEVSSDTKACPYCGEQIKAVAVKCKHCGEFLAKTPSHAVASPAPSAESNQDQAAPAPSALVSTDELGGANDISVFGRKKLLIVGVAALAVAALIVGLLLWGGGKDIQQHDSPKQPSEPVPATPAAPTRDQVLADHTAMLRNVGDAPRWTREFAARQKLATMENGDDELGGSNLEPHCPAAARADTAYQEANLARGGSNEFTMRDLKERRTRAISECLATMKRERPTWPRLMVLEVNAKAGTYDFGEGVLPIEIVDECGHTTGHGDLLLGCGVGVLEPRLLFSGFGKGQMDSTRDHGLLRHRLPEEQARALKARLPKKGLSLQLAFVPGDFGKTGLTLRPLGGSEMAQAMLTRSTLAAA